MAKRLSRNTFIMDKPPTIHSYAAVVGKKEGDGPLGRHFDQVYQDPYFGQDTWEKAESELLRLTVMKALEKGKLRCEDINYMFAGDLINYNMLDTHNKHANIIHNKRGEFLLRQSTLLFKIFS